MDDVYEGLREHLDQLPGGYPATETGVEIKLLKRLFTQEEAAMAQHLTLQVEDIQTISERAGVSAEKGGALLKEMAGKGLIFSIEVPRRPPVYMAANFVVGIWEYHVNDLDEEFVKDMEEFIPSLAKEALDKVPPLRTIPVGQSISHAMEILPYEQAEAMVRKQKKFLVAPCICRKEHQLKGKGCDKLMEGCLIFGWGADYYERNGLGRTITLDETLDILKKAEEDGLVLQPSNSQEITNICCCCGDCCQILLNLKRHPQPANMASSPFVVQVDPETCTGCEVCIDRCQMDALSMESDIAVLNTDRCIGCGLCVSTCPGESLTLVRKPTAEQTDVPRNVMEAFAMRSKARAEAKH